MLVKADITSRNISPLFSELFEKKMLWVYISVRFCARRHVGLFANLRQMEIITSKKGIYCIC